MIQLAQNDASKNADGGMAFGNGSTAGAAELLELFQF